MSLTILMDIFGYLLALLYGGLAFVALGLKGALSLRGFLFVVLYAAALALVLRKSWSRTLIIVASIVGIIEVAAQFLVFHRSDSFSVLFALLSGLVIFLCSLPEVKEHCLVPRTSPRVAGQTILVVDDDRTLLTLLKTNFSRKGFLTVTAETGEKGLALARQWKPNLILLDVILPGMKGRSVCARLKEDPVTKDIPVIFLTAKNSPDDVEAEIKAGAVAHITKPVNFQVLYAEVKKVLAR